jgi:hypothetical protein
LIGLSHDNLINYYTTNFTLLQDHKYNLSDIEKMIPWEREIYLNMLIEWMEKEEKNYEQANTV